MRRLVLLPLLVCFYAVVFGQQHFAGTVFEVGKPVEGAVIQFKGAGVAAVTDSKGKFDVQLTAAELKRMTGIVVKGCKKKRKHLEFSLKDRSASGYVIRVEFTKKQKKGKYALTPMMQ